MCTHLAPILEGTFICMMIRNYNLHEVCSLFLLDPDVNSPVVLPGATFGRNKPLHTRNTGIPFYTPSNTSFKN